MPAAWAADELRLPPFEEVYRLVRSNALGIGEADLDRAAVEGLLKQLHPRVLIASEEESTPPAGGSTSGLAGSRTFDRTLAYFRVSQVEPGLAEAFGAALAGLPDRNKLEGLVLDLRFARGTDYAEAGRIADGFVSAGRTLLIWGDAKFEASTKTNAFDRPVAVLVNSETRGAAEALAAALRHVQAGLLIGSTTAGQASLFKEFPLANGQRLRIASTPVCIGDGQQIPPKGIKPDIEVSVRLDDERLYLDDPYRSAPRSASTSRRAISSLLGGGTNRPSRITEADLVRFRREQQNLEGEFPPTARPATAEVPVVTDPALARALDLLKGLAVLKPKQTPAREQHP